MSPLSLLYFDEKEGGYMKSKSKILLIPLIFLFLFPGCSRKFSKYNYSHYKKLNKPEKQVSLNASTVLVGRESINFLGDFEIMGRYVLFIDHKSENAIKIFDLKSRKLLKSFGRKGQGPSEFIGATDIIPDPKDSNTFWVCDLTARKLKEFNIIKILNNDFSPQRIVTFNSRISPQLIITLDNGILGIDRSGKGRIAVYNMDGKLIRRIGKLPVKLKKMEFAPQHSHGFWGELAYKDKTKEIFLATQLGSIVERYDFESGKLLATYYGSDVFFPVYDIVPAGTYYTITHNKKTRYGYIDIQYNEKIDKIFLLYSGKPFYSKSGVPWEGAFTNVIYVLDKTGKITEEIDLNRKIRNIRIAPNGSAFYGSTENEILKFEYNPQSTK